MPLVEQIIADHAVDPAGTVAPGSIVTVRVDRVYVQDGNSPTVARLFDEHGFDSVFDASRVGVFYDHSVLAADAAMTGRLRDAEAFVERLGLQEFRQGTGISHVVALEEGWFEPGAIVLGADSHTCTGGVVQCLALGMGASDVVAAMVTGLTWLRVPETVWLRTTGTPHPAASAKDVILHLLARFRQDPFLYRSLEWTGPWVEGLPIDQAATVANMAVEMGAKCTFLPAGPGREHLQPTTPPDGAAVIDVDLDGLPPHISAPHSPFNAVPVDECAGQSINYVFVGSCANSRYDDLAAVAAVLDGERVHPRVHLVVTPGSQTVYLQAMKDGLIETIVRAGGVVAPPGCGSCVGTQGTIPGDGDNVLSTMNRNFLGRMGNPNANIWLSSPLVAARTAVLGAIPEASAL